MIAEMLKQSKDEVRCAKRFKPPLHWKLKFDLQHWPDVVWK